MDLWELFNRLSALCVLIVAFVMLRNSNRTQQELRRVNAQLRQQASRDELTGLWNRRAFKEKLNEILPQIEERHASLLMVDLDHFKAINDVYGHQVGDDVLEHVAAILRRNIRRVDVAARYGGEEFLILVLDADGHYAMNLAERIRYDIESTPDREHISAEVTASIGVVDLRGIDSLSVRSIIEAADRALYMAKESGRNRVFRGDRFLDDIPRSAKIPRNVS